MSTRNYILQFLILLLFYGSLVVLMFTSDCEIVLQAVVAGFLITWFRMDKNDLDRRL